MMLSLFLNAVYALLLLVISPVVIWRSVRHGKYRSGWGQKLFGRLPKTELSQRVIWFHAVSVGEILQLDTIIPEIVARNPDHTILISTTTNTGFDVARKKFSEHRICYFPLDFSWTVKNAIKRVRPDAIVLVELELWPNFIRAANAHAIPLALVNARVSERSYRGYGRVRPLVSRVLECFDAIGAQNDEYAARLVQLGAVNDSVEVTGSIKFDRVRTDRSHQATINLRTAFDIADSEVVFIAGSTQAPEEEATIEAYRILRDEFPNLRLIVVPRHKERFESVARIIEQFGLPFQRRSSPSSETAPRPIILLDTLGELSDCWGLADIAFVGGSFGERGGQNMLEPSGFGAAVLFGPRTENFAEIVSGLLANCGAKVVQTPGELIDEVRILLKNPVERERLGSAAQQFVTRNQGGAQKTIQLVCSLIEAENGSDAKKTRAA